MSKIVLIMAGGLGKRMNSDLPKVLHLLNNKPLIVHIIETAVKINPEKIGIIVGKYRQIIQKTINKYVSDNSKIEYINQPEALGTGHAILCCKPFLSKYSDLCVTILSGDVPLITSQTLERLNNSLLENGSALLVNKLENPFGYGRIKTKDERKIDLVNSGIYCFKNNILLSNIEKINNNNKQNEYYLTDIFNFINRKNIILINTENNYEVMGINNPEQLKELELICK
jgi:bifunctional N-acetylglucosamine-1-phosphate-uridyltransferase/glucosamine-1-phosphate-acetyltransferase GlmU-like protein